MAPVLPFPPRLLAEQLTQMDVELFRKVVTFDCVQAISTLRSEKGKEHLAPTIRAVITQMHRVSNCVMATCLGDQSTTASNRARILEHWECQVLLNFAALHAILSALWSNSIQHLKQTWEEASRDSIYHLEMMSKTSQKRELPGQIKWRQVVVSWWEYSLTNSRPVLSRLRGRVICLASHCSGAVQWQEALVLGYGRSS
ncbi:ral guanine nucleotide dissociation stimulator-like isoform X3 [Tamandua tetradactyla]|uniref:ral guanine nucleotide dissociation stimulator-like isoform X3 n=1 Tax=Tamandua tetradactyla TaxID=48850 RepID=UPI00405475D1